MEKKLKISEFAELIGVTAKTVYKMVEREELRTVNEKVNNRLITLVLTNDAEIENMKNIYGKQPVNEGNCKDILTDTNPAMNYNNPSQISHNAVSASDMLDKIIQINKEYNNELRKVNEELVNTKAQMLFLEDKASREGLYLKEINELKTENNLLRTSNKKVSYTLLTVIVFLLLVITGYFTYNIATGEKKEHAQEEIVNPQ